MISDDARGRLSGTLYDVSSLRMAGQYSVPTLGRSGSDGFPASDRKASLLGKGQTQLQLESDDSTKMSRMLIVGKFPVHDQSALDSFPIRKPD